MRGVARGGWTSRLPEGYRSREMLVFAGATALALLHALDDAFLSRQPGVPLGEHALAALVALAAGVLGIVAFPSLRPGLRAGLAFAFGVFALVNGFLHVRHITLDGPAASDATGMLAALAGAVLVALAVAIPWLHRGERARTRGRRWANRVVAAVGAAVVGYVVLFPVGGGIVQTHKYREPIGEPPGGFETVTFEATDGLELEGWYRPSENGAAVILVHGGGGDRDGARDHAALLARHGYGVLLYDSRGRGESEGSPNALGWEWPKDVDGALAFLRGRDDVEPGRVGGLGLSTGADVLIEVAAGSEELAAVVSDGATGRSLADYLSLDANDAVLGAPFYGMLTAAIEVITRSSPGRPLEELVPEVSPTPLLLVAAGGLASELDFNRVYAGVANEPFELWELPDVGHTAAVRERADEYEQKVVRFLDAALLR